MQLFESMEEEPDVVTFNATIVAWAYGGQWQQALSLFEAMPKKKLSVNTASFNSCITAGEKAWLFPF